MNNRPNRNSRYQSAQASRSGYQGNQGQSGQGTNGRGSQGGGNRTESGRSEGYRPRSAPSSDARGASYAPTSARQEDARPSTPREIAQGIFILDGRLRRILTKNLHPGKRFFEYEETVRFADVEYRVLDPRRSKLGAAIAKGLQQSGIRPGGIILYLGASHGYTPSYVSDIVGPEGFVFCLDVAPRVVRDLVFICAARENMAPLLCDAKHPETYAATLPKEGVDVVYQDIAQRDQVEIFVANCDLCLKKGGYGLLAIKARSIDVTRRPDDIFRAIKRQFETGEIAQRYVIVDYRELDPFEKDHAFFVVKKR